MLGMTSPALTPPRLRPPAMALLLVFLARTALGAASQSTQEDILMAVRQQLEGSESAEGSLLAGWAVPGSACAWAGVACDPLGAITSLDFSGQGLSGTLPAQLADLEGLQALVLVNNSIGGVLPVEWSSLMDLEVLALDTNRITGSLPAMWAALGSLRELRLRNNRLSGGGLPAAWGGGLGALQVIDLSDNPHLGQGMRSLGLAAGPSTGVLGAGAQLPGSWGRLPFLRSLLLRNTGLAGTLPADLATLRRLVHMDLSSNAISGTLPEPWAPGSSAPSSSGASGLTALRQTDLSDNWLVGTLPAGWSSFASLQYLNLARNALSGTVPEAWGAQRGLAVLRLSDNAALCGPVLGVLQPMLLAGAANATANGAAGRNGTSSAAQETAALAAAINGTQLLRSCPWSQTGSLLLSLRQSMSGPSSTLAEWAEGADPCGVATAWEGVLCDSVTRTVTGLDLSNKGLSGALPPQLALLSGLGRLVLDGNSLTGTLPGGWSQLGALSHVSLRRNRLAGGLPAAWSALYALSYLDLSYNGLRGALPPMWGNGLRRIAQIHLDGNNLNGTLPQAWGYGSSAGNEPTAAGNGTGDSVSSLPGLVTLVSLHADSNSLSGPLPAAWSRLQQLQELSLKDNLLTGPVPHEWAEASGMSSLRYLGLSSNTGMCGPAPAATPVAAPAPAPATSNATGHSTDSTSNTNSTNSTNSTSSASSAVFRLEADYTQLGAACPPPADSGSGAAVAAGAQLWIAAGAGSVGTLVLVGVIAAATSAVNRRRAAASSSAGASDAAAKHGSIAAAVATRRRASTGGGADGSRSPAMDGGPRAPAGSPRCASMTSPSGRVGSYSGIHGLVGGALGPVASPQSFLVAQRLRSAPSPSAMLAATHGSGAAASAARRLYGGSARSVASDGEDGGGRKARAHASQQQQYQPRLSNLAPNRVPGAPPAAQRGADDDGASLVAADKHLSPWHNSAVTRGGDGGVRTVAEDGLGLQFAPSPTRSMPQPRSPLNTPPHSPRAVPFNPSNASAAPLASPRPGQDALPEAQDRLDSFGWLWGGSAGADAGEAAACDEHPPARSGLLSTGVAAAITSFTRIVGGFVPRRSSTGSGVPAGSGRYPAGAVTGAVAKSSRLHQSVGGQAGGGAYGDADGGPDEDMAVAADLYQAMAMAQQRGAQEAVRSGASTPRGAATIRSPRLSTNPLFAGPETDAIGNAAGGSAETQSALAIMASGPENHEQMQQPGTQMQRKPRASAGLGEDDSDSEQQSAEQHAKAGDTDDVAHMLSAPTFMFRSAAATTCDQGPGRTADWVAAHGPVSTPPEDGAAAGYNVDSPRLGMLPMAHP